MLFVNSATSDPKRTARAKHAAASGEARSHLPMLVVWSSSGQRNEHRSKSIKNRASSVSYSRSSTFAMCTPVEIAP